MESLKYCIRWPMAHLIPLSAAYALPCKDFRTVGDTQLKKQCIIFRNMVTIAIKEEYSFFGHKNGYVNVSMYVYVCHCSSYPNRAFVQLCVANSNRTVLHCYCHLCSYKYTFIQVEAGFCSMCGNDATKNC